MYRVFLLIIFFEISKYIRNFMILHYVISFVVRSIIKLIGFYLYYNHRPRLSYYWSAGFWLVMVRGRSHYRPKGGIGRCASRQAITLLSVRASVSPLLHIASMWACIYTLVEIAEICTFDRKILAVIISIPLLSL